jgi:O-antigen/teichoic acid export membrane protein
LKMEEPEKQTNSEPVAKKPSLRANFIYNFISQLLTLLVPLATTPYLSRVLHEEGNGQYSYSLSIITIFLLFANLGFTTYGQREIARCQDDKEAKSECFWEIVILRTISTLVVTAVFFSVLYTVGFKKCNNLILIFGIELVGTIFDIQFLYFGEEDFKSIAIRTIVLKICGMIGIFCFVKTENDTWIYTLCISVSTVFSYLILWPQAFKRVSFVKAKSLNLKKHLVPVLAIFVPTVAITVYATLDKTMIGLLIPAGQSDYENGCYEQAYKINSIALLLVTVISPVMTSRNASDYKKGDYEAIKRHIDYAESYVWMIGAPLIGGFAALSYNVCAWFLGSGYAEVPLLLQIMSVRFILSGFSEIFGSQLFLATRQEKYFSIATITTALVDFGTNFWLIPILGATGAAITTAASEFICCSILLFFACKHKYVSIKALLIKSWKYLLSAGVMFVALYFTVNLLPYKIWSFLVFLIGGSLIYGLMLFALRDRFFLNICDKIKAGFLKIFIRKHVDK